MSNWIATFSGSHIDFENPNPAEVDIEDIARALARIPRFLGHTRSLHSVAQHSVGVCKIVPYVWSAKEWSAFGEEFQRGIRYEALLHDAAEAYTGDLPTPAKKSLGTVWREMERRIDKCVRRALGCVGAEPASVKVADQVALYLEATGRNGTGVGDWDYAFPPRTAEIIARIPEAVQEFIQTPLKEYQAKRVFMSHYRRLTRVET